MILEGLIIYRTPLLSLKDPKEFDFFMHFEDGYVGLKQCTGTWNASSNILLSTKDSFKTSTNNTFLKDNLQQQVFINLVSANNGKEPKVGMWLDRSEKLILLSREFFGSVPLFYIHIPNLFFAFSTSLTTLISNAEVRQYLQVNLRKVTSYFSSALNNINNQHSDTFFSNIHSVPPGHFLSVNSIKATSTPFVTLSLEKFENLTSIHEYASTTRNLLSKSISNITQSDSEVVASHLSGGLDSSSVSSAFKNIYPYRGLHTLHIKANNQASDESMYSRLVARQIQSLHHEIPQSCDDLGLLRLSTALYGQPETSYLSPASNVSTINYAKQLGCNILLNGHGGDSVIGSGMEVLEESYKQKNWANLDRFLRMRVDFFSLTQQYPSWLKYSREEKYHIVLQNFLYTQISRSRPFSVQNIYNLFLELPKAMRMSPNYFVTRVFNNYLLRKLHRSVKSESSILRSELIYSDTTELTKFESVPFALRGNLKVEFQPVFDDVVHPQVIRSQEQHFDLSNHFGIEVRAPFMNLELLELCLSIPNLIKFGDGKGRTHLREAMKGILPEEVRNRSTKATLSSPDGEAMTNRLYAQASQYLEDSREIWYFVDKTKFKKQIQILKNDKIPYVQKSKTYFHVTRTISFAIWLEWLRNSGLKVF